MWCCKDPIPALLEHRQFGLPDRESVTRWFSNNPYPWIGFGQGNTDVWLLMMLTYHSLRMPGTDFVQELNRRFNQVYAAEDWAEPNYRAGYLLSKRHSLADLEEVRAIFRPPPANRPISQSVLAFCQLFLTIAQNGRHGDRHIRNIEQELTRANPTPCAPFQHRKRIGGCAGLSGEMGRRIRSAAAVGEAYPGSSSVDCTGRFADGLAAAANGTVVGGGRQGAYQRDW
jgi:hypothetical protein